VEQAGFVLTNKQVEKLQDIASTFYERAVDREIFDGPFLLLLNAVRSCIVEREALEQYQIDVLVWLLEAYIGQFEEGDIDPAAEDCYHKLVGYWFEDIEPWYKRIKELDRDIVQP
jgi:hypothetical protein